MKKIALIVMMVFGVMASSYNNSKEVATRPPVEDINNSLDNLQVTLDSLNAVFDGKDK